MKTLLLLVAILMALIAAALCFGPFGIDIDGTKALGWLSLSAAAFYVTHLIWIPDLHR